MTSDPSSRQLRGQQLIAKVLAATLAEIEQSGLEKLSLDGVAARAGVNKTTIWRRWRTPAALALAALTAVSDHAPPVDTGSLRGDLADYLKRLNVVCRSPAMASLVRLRLRGVIDGELGTMVAGCFCQMDNQASLLFQHASLRGELPAGADVTLLREIAVGSMQYLIATRKDGVADHEIDILVGSLLDGMLAHSV